MIIENGTEIVLNLNFPKNELLSAISFTCSSAVLTSFKRVSIQDSSLLGAPLVAGSALDSIYAAGKMRGPLQNCLAVANDSLS